MADLLTRYLGLTLESPLVPSASPLTADLDTIRRLEDAGAGAIVLPSLFEEQLIEEAEWPDVLLAHGTYTDAQASTYLPEPSSFTLGVEQYLEHLQRTKSAVRVPIIASLNGVAAGSWTEVARAVVAAGADAIELNVNYVPGDPELTSAVIEDEYIALVREVSDSVAVPIAVKLSPFFTNFLGLATRLDTAGARGLVLFNRFTQADLDLARMELVPHADLTEPGDASALRLPLHWIASLYGRLNGSLAATGGVHSAEDALKLLLVGADVTMLASELIRGGPARLAAIRADLERWLDDHEYPSVCAMRGILSHQRVSAPAALERAQYVRAVASFRHLATS
jgi:dihydroorotate dehydrogenase (fumarate)